VINRTNHPAVPRPKLAAPVPDPRLVQQATLFPASQTALPSITPRLSRRSPVH